MRAWKMALLVGLVSGLALTVACTGQSVQLQVQLLRKSCPSSDGIQVDALTSVTHLEFIITGDGIPEPLTSISAVGDGHATLDLIPLGETGQIAERRIEVRAHFDAPDGPVTARGLAVVQLDPSVLHPPTIPIFLRPVQSFVYTADGAAPETCTKMNRARAGHTATTLNDGRVLIVGGAEFDALGGRTVHDSAEIYDPFSGTFELKVRGSGGPSLPRVFHTATKLQDGRVVIVGGEFDKSGSDRDVLRPAEIFRPASGEFDGQALIAQTGRTRHQASGVGDYVLISGGYADPNPVSGHPVPIAAVELFDGVNENFVVAQDLPEPRAEHCAVALDRGVVAIAGGITTAAGGGVKVSNTIHFYRVSDGKAVLLETDGSPLVNQLTTGRFGMGCVPVRQGADLLLLMAGGYTKVDDFSAASVSGAVELFNPSASSRVSDAGNLPAGARGNLCAVQVDETTAVFMGGFNSSDLPASRGSEWVSTANGTVKLAQTTGRKLSEGRYLSQCTRLLDGSILVTGGLSPDAGGTPVSVRSAELYTPLVR